MPEECFEHERLELVGYTLACSRWFSPAMSLKKTDKLEDDGSCRSTVLTAG